MSITAIAFVVAVVAAGRSLWSPCGLSMLTSITPFAERSRGYRYPVTAAWFVAGAVTGGTGLGLLAAVGAALVAWCHPPTLVIGVIAAAASLIGAAADLRLGGLRLPMHPRQVDETWLRKYRSWVYATGFGLQIGCGLATYIMTAAVYVTLALAALTASALTALLIGAAFGLVRGLAVLVGSSASTPDRLRVVLGYTDRLAGTSKLAAVGVQLWSASALIGGLLRLAVVPLVTAAILAAVLSAAAVAAMAGRTGTWAPAVRSVEVIPPT